jgi:hypothetical protein
MKHHFDAQIPACTNKDTRVYGVGGFGVQSITYSVIVEQFKNKSQNFFVLRTKCNCIKSVKYENDITVTLTFDFKVKYVNSYTLYVVEA